MFYRKYKDILKQELTKARKSTEISFLHYLAKDYFR